MYFKELINCDIMARNITVENNTARNRFETNVDGETAFIDYKIKNNLYYITHTEVPKGLRGQGIASAMTGKVLEQLQKRDQKIVPVCPFTKEYVDEHPKYQSMVE